MLSATKRQGAAKYRFIGRLFDLRGLEGSIPEGVSFNAILYQASNVRYFALLACNKKIDKLHNQSVFIIREAEQLTVPVRESRRSVVPKVGVAGKISLIFFSNVLTVTHFDYKLNPSRSFYPFFEEEGVLKKIQVQMGVVLRKF